MDFKEEREQTMEREIRLHDWPHSSPSPSAMFTAGWFYDKTKGSDHTMCLHCGVEYHNWQSKDNPWTVHQNLSPFCPYLLAAQPIHMSSVRIKTMTEVFTKEKIDNEISKSTSSLISTTTSSYGLPPHREKSFKKFPGGLPSNTGALVNSGFYFTGIGTIIQCYDCEGRVNDFHRYAPNEINARHRGRFPLCHFAQLLPENNATTAIRKCRKIKICCRNFYAILDDSDLCKWCLINRKEIAIYPCMHLAVCRPCTQWISSCPICNIDAETFVKLYT